MAAPRPAQLRAVGTAFLRQRPLVAAPIAVANGTLFAAGGAPAAQLIALGTAAALMIGMFVVERRLGARRDLSEAALARSLAMTTIGLALACGLTGGLASPFVPLLLAPTGIGFAAFGRSRTSAALLGLLVASAAVLATIGAGPFPVLGSPYREVATAIGLVGATVLLRLGVAALADAHGAAAATLARTGDEVARAAREREAIGARVAHEVKNPLSAIRALVEVMIEARRDAATARDGIDDARRAAATARDDIDARRAAATARDAPDDARRAAATDRDAQRLGVIAGEVARIERILHEYLDQHRPLSALEPAVVDVGVVVRDVVAVLAARAERAHVALLADGAAAPAEVDARRLKEAILNLALNALDASDPGGMIELRWQRAGDGVTIEVADRGRGMSADELVRVGTPGFTTRERGAGLGVVLARGVVEQHGGELRFASARGRGTTATIRLPARWAAPTTTAASGPATAAAASMPASAPAPAAPTMPASGPAPAAPTTTAAPRPGTAAAASMPASAPGPAAPTMPASGPAPPTMPASGPASGPAPAAPMPTTTGSSGPPREAP